MVCILDWRGGSSKNTKRPLSELEEETIQLYTNYTPWRMMCVQLKKKFPHSGAYVNMA